MQRRGETVPAELMHLTEAATARQVASALVPDPA
jgi:hypothetical protein